MHMEMSKSRLWLLGAAVLVLTAAQSEASTAATRSCNRVCGGVNIPYPFGLDGDEFACYLQDEFVLTCNTSVDPPKLLFHDNIVTGVDVLSGQLRILVNISYSCYNSTGKEFASYIGKTILDPFVLSSTKNVFTVVGCDSRAEADIGDQIYCGCLSGCNSLDSAVDGDCTGIGCCQTSIPQGVKSYGTNYYYRNDGSKVYAFNPCTYLFMAEKNNYTFHTSDLKYMDRSRQFPVIVDWSIGSGSCEEAAMDKRTYACVANNSGCVNSTNGPGYLCVCSKGYQGNPYLPSGCQDIDECQMDRGIYPCNGICTNTIGGYECSCPKGYRSENPMAEVCVREAMLSHQALLSVGVGGGLLLLFLICTLGCLESQRRKLKALRQKRFKANGGIYLQQLLSAHPTNFKIYTCIELEKATNNFSKANILGRGGFGIVYKGVTKDRTEIAVKTSMAITERNARQFANELLILSKVNHINIVRLLGCCLEDNAPMLVYEFVRGGSLFDYLHNNNHRSICFNTRLQIATQVAEAFTYLHFDASPPVLHGDVKSSNILLGEHLLVKVSDFGTSLLAPNDNTKFATTIQGTSGYLDPEYLTTYSLTDKSDVFSLGVVLVELLTRRKPLNYSANGETERILYANFLSCVGGNKIKDILDPQLLEEGLSEDVEEFVAIALDCLKTRGEERPPMKEVARRLGSIKRAETSEMKAFALQSNPKGPEGHLRGSSSSSSSMGPQSFAFSLGRGR